MRRVSSTALVFAIVAAALPLRAQDAPPPIVTKFTADLGFVALAQVIDTPGGSRWLVPEACHAPIEQQAILLFTGQKNPAAKAFLAFLRSPRALAVIKRYGYEVR